MLTTRSAQHLTKTLSAGMLAAVLAFTSLAPTPARAEISEGDAIVGVLTLLLLGAALSDRDDDPAPQVTHPPRGPRGEGNWRRLPVQCQFTINTRRGDRQRMYGRRCMERNYAQLNRLPDRCYVRVRNVNNQVRQGWRPRCLRAEGFRVNWH